MWVVYISGYNFSGVPVERRFAGAPIWAQPSILYIPSLQLGHEGVALDEFAVAMLSGLQTCSAFSPFL
jgi:hypothetical protein